MFFFNFNFIASETKQYQRINSQRNPYNSHSHNKKNAAAFLGLKWWHFVPFFSSEISGQVTCSDGLLMVSRSSLARVATAGLTSSTDVRKQQKAWANEYFSRWFFVTAPMSRNLHSTATFSTGSNHERKQWQGGASLTRSHVRWRNRAARYPARVTLI